MSSKLAPLKAAMQLYDRLKQQGVGLDEYIRLLDLERRRTGSSPEDMGDFLRVEHDIPDLQKDWHESGMMTPDLAAMRSYSGNSNALSDLFRYSTILRRWAEHSVPNVEDAVRYAQRTEGLSEPVTKSKMRAVMSGYGYSNPEADDRLEKTRNLLKLFRPAKRDMLLFRGLGDWSRTRRELRDKIARDPTGVIYGNQGFLGTSAEPNVAAQFGNKANLDYAIDPKDPGRFMILVPKDTPILPFGVNSSYQSEAEVLLPPHSWLEEMGTEPYKKGNYEYLPLIWRGRGRGPDPDRTRFIGGVLPLSLLNEYDDGSD